MVESSTTTPQYDNLLYGPDRFRAIIESSDDAIISKDLTGIITSWNKGAERLFGYTPDEIIGRSVRTLVPPDLQGQEDEILARLKAGERIEHFETVRLRKDGTLIDLSLTISPVKDDDGRVIGASNVARDISLRLQAAALQNRLSAIVESSDDAIISKELDGTITSWNQGATRIFGYTSEEAIGRSITMLIPDDLLDEEREILQRLRNGQRIDHFETVRRRKNGELVDLSLTISPVHDGRGRVIGASKVARDITARKGIEEELRNIARRKDEFLATLAHELRNPLAPLSNALQLLDLAADDPALAMQARGTMDRQLKHLIHLVEDLMDLSRVNRGAIELRRSTQDLRAAVVQGVEAARGLVNEQGHHLDMDLGDFAPWVSGDTTRLVQIVANLVNNAAKYTEPGGLIRVVVRRVNGSAEVEVTDSGIGIDRSALHAVFDMFAQLETASSRRHGGLGIGLSVVKQLVALHGGSITAHSEGHGTGSTFTVRLPLVDAPNVARPPTETEATTTASLRILVADDNTESAVSLSLLLRNMHHTVRAVHNGPDAIVEASRFQPQLIFLDIGMPVMDGYEACRRIRAEAHIRRPYIVALTGWGQDQDKRLARDAGFDQHVVKPIDRTMLNTVLNTVEERGRGGPH